MRNLTRLIVLSALCISCSIFVVSVSASTSTNANAAPPASDIAITLTYDFVPIDESAPNSASATQFLPIMQPDYLHWLGPTSWVVPMIPAEGKGTIALVDFPATWAVASSFGTDRQLSFSWSPGALIGSMIIAGDFRLIRQQSAINDRSITLAIRGQWPASDETYASTLVKIIDGERRFWGDKQGGDFVATLLPLEKSGPSIMIGTAFLNSFTTLMTTDKSLVEIQKLWTHETLHQWLPRAFGRVEGTTSTLAWFGEGFTDYYTQVLMLRWRLVQIGDVVAELNTALRGLVESDYAPTGNAEVATRFARHQNIQLLAASWDSDIRAHSKGKLSLDDALLWLLAEQRQSKQPILTQSVIEAAMQRFGVQDPAKDIARFTAPSEALSEALTVRLRGSLPCVATETVVVPVAIAGFDVAQSENAGKISGVSEQSAAYTAGLRNGQEVVQMPFAPTASGREVNVTVKVAGMPQVIRYMPDQQVARKLQQLRVKDADACAAFYAAR